MAVLRPAGNPNEALPKLLEGCHESAGSRVGCRGQNRVWSCASNCTCVGTGRFCMRRLGTTLVVTAPGGAGAGRQRGDPEGAVAR
eukprot:11571922-Heterocapsa_arctica.AAC.2